MSAILVIDDEKMVLEIIETALTTFGHYVELAEDGEEGIRKFDEGLYDLVITDLIMPNTDGKEVIDHIRSSKKRKTPIIGISGTPWMMEDSGVDSILSKPFPIKALLDTVRDLVPVTVN